MRAWYTIFCPYTSFVLRRRPDSPGNPEIRSDRGNGAESFGDVAIHDRHWRALAAAHDAAYLCPHYRLASAECQTWYDPRNGSAAVLQRALDDFSAQTGHAELASAPLCLWGHSGGGI